MSMEWYRAYHGMPYDPKLRVIAKRTGQPMAVVVAVWTCILDAASQHDPRGIINIDPEEVAVVQDIELEIAKAIIQEFYNKKMIDENNHLTAWDKRQHTTSTERSQKFRENKKLEATRCNAAQQDAAKNNKEKQIKTQNQEKTDQIREDTEQKRTDAEENRIDSDSKKYSKQKRAREEKKESEKEKHEEKILNKMLQIWNAEVQEELTKGNKAVLTAKRKEKIKTRWVEDFKEDIRAWQHYCEVISASDFCMGRIEGKNWTIDLGWAVESSEHVVKILEGGFSGGKHPVPMPPCYDPQLQIGWDHVLACFTNKYGKAVCQSWLSGALVSGAEITDSGAVVTIICQTSFIREWITKHYLRDMHLWWGEHSYQSRRITKVQLKLKEVNK